MDTAAVMEAFTLEAEANLAYAQREVDAVHGKAVEICARANVAAQEAERRARLHARGVAGEEEAESASYAASNRTFCTSDKSADFLARQRS